MTEHRHEYGPCCEHFDQLNDRLAYIELLVTPPVVEEPVVAEPVEDTTDSDTDSDSGSDEDASVDIDIDIDVHAESEEGSSPEESESHTEDEDEGVDVDESEEMVITGETGLPELTEDEKERDKGHPLPMRR